MKSHPLASLAIMASAAFVHAQDQSAAASGAPAIISTAARILGAIPDGVPPPVALPRRKLVVQAKDVLETKTHQQGGRTVTIRKIKPLPLPPPPVPTPPRDSETESEFRRLAAAYSETHHNNSLLFLGATVFRSADAPPRSLVRWWPQNGGEAVTFWSSADFALIAGGINSFVDSAGETHTIFMSWGNADLDRLTKFRAAAGQQDRAPVIPAFAQGTASFQFEGVQPDADELIAIQSLHDLYHNNLAALTSAWQGLERARIAREAYLKAHPPKPENITIDYWRTEEPAAKGVRP